MTADRIPSAVKAITPDNFVRALRLQGTGAELLNRPARLQLYELLVQYMSQEKILEEGLRRRPGAGGMTYVIPGTPVHVRMNNLVLDNLARFASVYLLLSGASKEPILNITAAVVASVIDRISRLRTEFGERCAIEALSELKHRTKDNACVHLFGKACRYPSSGCQFQKYHDASISRTICSVTQEGMERVLNHLKEKKIVSIDGPSDPPQWRITT